MNDLIKYIYDLTAYSINIDMREFLEAIDPDKITSMSREVLELYINDWVKEVIYHTHKRTSRALVNLTFDREGMMLRVAYLVERWYT